MIPSLIIFHAWKFRALSSNSVEELLADLADLKADETPSSATLNETASTKDQKCLQKS